METLLQDLRYAMRQLRRAPGFTVTAIVTLALGIGVTVTVAALVRQALLAPLPYPQPEQIVGLAFHWPGEPPNDNMTGTAGEFLIRNTRSFSALALLGAADTANFSLNGGHAKSVSVMNVSKGYFSVLGVSPHLGRGFTDAEDRLPGPKAAVLSYSFWKNSLGGDSGVIGRTIHLNEQDVTVVGVMPRTFRAQGDGLLGVVPAPDMWTALQVAPTDPGYQYNNYEMIARLRRGVTVAQAREELNALQPRLYAFAPFYKKEHTRGGLNETLQMYPYADVIASSVRPSLLVMTWAAAAVLLLTCLNLAGLNTARALHRAPELALRISLGATPARLLRLAVLELGLVALTGVAGAVVVARLLVSFLLKASPIALPTLNAPSGVAALFAGSVLLGLLCAGLVGLPFVVAASWLRRTSAGGTQRISGVSRMQSGVGRSIVIAQMSLALVLLSVSAMLLGTFLKLRAQPLGFQPEKLVAFQTSLKGGHYATTLGTGQFATQVLERLRQTPGVDSAAAVVGLPLQRGLNDGGWTAAHPDQAQTIQLRTISPGFLHTTGILLLRGRAIKAEDGAGQQHVAVISLAAAEKFFPGQSAIGQTLYVDTKENGYRVVGITADTPQDQLGQPPDLTVYAPIAQQVDTMTAMLNGWFPVSFVAKTEAHIDMATVARKAVASVDPEIPVTGLTTMREVVDNSVAAPRFFTQIAEGFAAFALLLTAIGLFGLLSYQVTQRTREIGIRMALGASRLRVLLGVLRMSASMALIGSAIGVVAATLLHPMLTRWIMDDVAGLDATQTRYMLSGTAAVGAALLAVALTVVIAGIEPARRASRVEPMEALRKE
jgi:predicted permease